MHKKGKNDGLQDSEGYEVMLILPFKCNVKTISCIELKNTTFYNARNNCSCEKNLKTKYATISFPSNKTCTQFNVGCMSAHAERHFDVQQMKGFIKFQVSNGVNVSGALYSKSRDVSEFFNVLCKHFLNIKLLILNRNHFSRPKSSFHGII